METLGSSEVMASAGVIGRIAGHWSSTVLIALGFLVVYAVGQRIRGWYSLRHFKGPFSAGFSRLWIFRRSTGGRLHLDLAEVNDKFGMHTSNTNGEESSD